MEDWGVGLICLWPLLFFLKKREPDTKGQLVVEYHN